MDATTWDFATPPPDELLARAEAQLDNVARTLRMAGILISHGRTVDLTGLDQQVGRLCAQVLDLGWGTARTLRPKLAGLLGELDRLTASLNHA